MKQFLSLLFLSFFCTCVSAQTPAGSTEPVPQEIKGSGSLLVEFGDGTWTLSLSSGTRYEQYRYVTEAEYRRRPVHYGAFTVVQGTDRFDLRMVHRLIEKLSAEGWQLTATNYSHSQSGNDWGTNVDEKIFYQFSVPSTYSATVKFSGTVAETIPITVGARNKLRLRGALNRDENGAARLEMEEWVGGTWISHYRLESVGLLSPEVVDGIREIKADKGRLTFSVEAADGNYKYHFTRGGKGYFFSGLHYMSNNSCGVLQYSITSTQTLTGMVTGYIRPEPCDEDAGPTLFTDRQLIRRTWLKDFEVGGQKIDLAAMPQALVY